VKCWLFWACFAVVASCVSCLSAADYTVAESGSAGQGGAAFGLAELVLVLI